MGRGEVGHCYRKKRLRIYIPLKSGEDIMSQILAVSSTSTSSRLESVYCSTDCRGVAMAFASAAALTAIMLAKDVACSEVELHNVGSVSDDGAVEARGALMGFSFSKNGVKLSPLIIHYRESGCLEGSVTDPGSATCVACRSL